MSSPRASRAAAAGQAEERAMETMIIDPHRPYLGGNIRHGDLRTFCPVPWAYLIERFAVESVLDVGCGEGHAVHWFYRRGLFVHGIDGLETNVRRAVVPVARHDLTTGPYLMPVDMVWSCEVAEHISPEYLDNYLDTLANGRVIAMTHAVPGQGGHHHVNCQPREYWIEKVAARGYRYCDESDVIRDIAGKDQTWNHFQNTGLIFVAL
jgi:cyclopropane fatty-acyl-phospholipid synthase-like methyltransferase